MHSGLQFHTYVYAAVNRTYQKSKTSLFINQLIHFCINTLIAENQLGICRHTFASAPAWRLTPKALRIASFCTFCWLLGAQRNALVRKVIPKWGPVLYNIVIYSSLVAFSFWLDLYWICDVDILHRGHNRHISVSNCHRSGHWTLEQRKEGFEETDEMKKLNLLNNSTCLTSFFLPPEYKTNSCYVTNMKFCKFPRRWILLFWIT